MKSKKKRIVIGAAAVMLLGLAAVFFLVWNGVILLNNPSPAQYPVQGVDVSAYQGEIDWEVLSAQEISFAFIKATEGSSFTDPCFQFNWSEAQKTNLRIGAYHFFSYDSAGETQAEQYIATVPKLDGMLPPVIDLEFYGDKEKNPPEQTAVREQLEILLSRLEEHYGQKPILYATEKSYRLYLAGGFSEYDIWIRNVLSSPRLSDDREWTFWQYTNRARLKGYHGEESYIDKNVFYGSAEQFAAYAK